LALNAIAERDAAIAERDRLIELNDRLRHLLRKAQGFEAKSERLAKLHPEQLNLALEDLEQAIAKAEAIEQKTQVADTPRKRRINRGALPAHLPRTHETVAPADTNCPCCKKPMHVIGEETSERLDVIPAQYRVIITHRPRLACRACEKIVEAPAPEHLIKSGLPTEAMVASVLVAKYGWHLPLYRQAKNAGLPGHRPRPLDAGLLGRLCGGGIDAAVRAAQGQSLGLRQTRRRRDAGAGARSRARSDEDWLLLGDCAR
jgi:transposase